MRSSNIMTIQQEEQRQKYKSDKYGHKLYERFLYCDFCMRWIPKDKVVWSKKKVRTIPECPKPSCNGNRLKTQSTNYKYKNKKDVERRASKEY